MFEPLQLSVIEEKGLARELVEQSEKLDSDFSSHKHSMIYCDHGKINTKLNCYLSPTNPAFVLPSKEQLRLVVDHILSLNYSKQEISRFLGISSDGNRTLNYWLSDNDKKQINKSNWVLLTQLAGLTLVTALPKKDIS